MKANTDMTLNDLLAIAAGQSARDKEMAKFSDRLKRLAADQAQLATDFAVFVNGNANGVTQATASKPKKRAAPPDVTYEEIDAVHHLLSDKPLTVKELARAALDGKMRKTAEALRELAAVGVAVENPRGKWTIVATMPAPAEDGASA